MTEFLVRHFVKDYENVKKVSVRTAYGVLASVTAVSYTHLVGFEAAEMINAQRVQDFQLILDTFDPPGESVCLMNLPVVERVAPELSGGRKIIRRYACDSQRISGSIKLE